MSTQLIQQYHAKVERIIRYGGSRNESALRKPFQDLLEQYAASRDLLLVSEVEYRRRGVRVIPDGTLKDALRQDWGYWESKDEKDNLADEIAAKLAKGYPPPTSSSKTPTPRCCTRPAPKRNAPTLPTRPRSTAC